MEQSLPFWREEAGRTGACFQQQGGAQENRERYDGDRQEQQRAIVPVPERGLDN